MNHGTSLIRRWFSYGLFVFAISAGQIASARVLVLRGNFCQATNEASIREIYWRATITIDPAQVTPPDNVIVHSGNFANNNSIPYSFLGAEYGAARGQWVVEWRTNISGAWSAAEPSTIAFTTESTFTFKMGPDNCNLYTPQEYCVKVKACNASTYPSTARLYANGTWRGLSPRLKPGECFTFDEVCTTNKASVYLLWDYPANTADGFETDLAPDLFGLNNPNAFSTNSTPGTAPIAVSTNLPPLPVFAAGNTNNQPIQFQGGTNAATDQTSKDGFNALYRATVEGFESTKAELRKGFGDVGTNIAAGNNINKSGFQSLSNGLAGINGTLLGMSNGLKGELNSNNIASIRGNTSNTVEGLRVVTNLLSGILTNRSTTNSGIGSGEATTWTAQGESAASSTKASLDGLRGTIPTSPGTAPSSTDLSVTVDGNLLSLDIMGQAGPLLSYVRTLILWLATLGYLYFVSGEVFVFMRASAGARQASSAATTPIASTGVALAMAVAMTVALAAIPALLVVAFGGYATILGVSPYAGATGIVASAIGWADKIMPLDAILTYALSGLAFRLLVGSTFFVSTTVVRFLVGCIVIGGLTLTSQAIEVTVENRASCSVHFTEPVGGYYVNIEPGQSFKFPYDLQFTEGMSWTTNRDMTGPIDYEHGTYAGVSEEAEACRFYIVGSMGAIGYFSYEEKTNWSYAWYGFLTTLPFMLWSICTNIYKWAADANKVEHL